MNAHADVQEPSCATPRQHAGAIGGDRFRPFTGQPQIDGPMTLGNCRHQRRGPFKLSRNPFVFLRQFHQKVMEKGAGA